MKLSCQEGLAPGKTFAEKLRNLEAYGFEGVELAGAHLNDEDGLAERRAALKDSPVKASSICGGFEAEMIHPDPQRRRACVDVLKRYLDLAAELGATGPISVPIFNRNARVPDMAPWKTQHEAEIELLRHVLEELARYAEGTGACLLLEPLNRYESNALRDVEEAAEPCRAVGKGVRVMADFFHMHIEQPNTPRSFAAIADVLGHVHLADNTRKEPGTGDIDFTAAFKVLKEVGFDGYMAFECSLSDRGEVALPQSVAYLRACLAKA
ncbi:sugar phosphate isomerase/epimerase family protein [Candidatus Entotheonella palauensis]|uniref:sugar phosphate isomerase/epimerase family protein n=1 Tax=Candidatus Entotheonella palauensis TaxID=93172 RepID=UPI000B7D7E6C|nr:sugar phosphate isomerase/epimerase family protein [Candidatus Entotheonella palauensis]